MPTPRGLLRKSLLLEATDVLKLLRESLLLEADVLKLEDIDVLKLELEDSLRNLDLVVFESDESVEGYVEHSEPSDKSLLTRPPLIRFGACWAREEVTV